MSSDRDRYLESQLRNGSITVRDFIRGLLLSDRFLRGYVACNSNYRLVEQVIGRALGRKVRDNTEKLAYSIVIASSAGKWDRLRWQKWLAAQQSAQSSTQYCWMHGLVMLLNTQSMRCEYHSWVRSVSSHPLETATFLIWFDVACHLRDLQVGLSSDLSLWWQWPRSGLRPRSSKCADALVSLCVWDQHKNRKRARSLCHECAYQINSSALDRRLNCELVCGLSPWYNDKLLG